MTLPKKNIDQLKMFLNNKNNKFNKITKSNIHNLPKNNSYNTNRTNEIFYEIIDNSEYLEDTLLHNKKLKESEEKLIQQKKSIHINDKNSSQINYQLSEEDLLYDEFNYLLDE